MRLTIAALQEGSQNIAQMFSALADSEAVHARNFKRILRSLHNPPEKVDISAIRAGNATGVELAEIDREYPYYIRRIRPEGHKRQFVISVMHAQLKSNIAN